MGKIIARVWTAWVKRQREFQLCSSKQKPGSGLTSRDKLPGEGWNLDRADGVIRKLGGFTKRIKKGKNKRGHIYAIEIIEIAFY